MFKQINEKLETVTSSPVFAMDTFRMPLDVMLTSAGAKAKAAENSLKDIDDKIKKHSSNPHAVAKLQAQKTKVHADIAHLKKINPGHVVSRDFRKVSGMNNVLGKSTNRVMNGVAKPINALLTKYPKIAKPYKFYSRGMDAIGVASLVSPLAEMGYNTGKAAIMPKVSKVISTGKTKAGSLLREATKEEKAFIYNTCRQYPEEFCLNSPEAYGLIADRIFKQDSYMYQDKGFLNGGVRAIPEVDDIEDPYYIRIVHTLPEHQGKGVAKEMLEGMIERNPSESGHWMMVNEDNTGMQKCASKLGFEKIHQLTQDDGHITEILYKGNS